MTLFLLICTLGFQTEIEKLESRLGEAEGLEKARLYYELAEASENFSPQKAAEYGELGLALVRKMEQRELEANLLGGLGFNYGNLGKYREALEHQNEALALRRELKNEPGIAKSLNNIGIVYYYLGNGEKALEYYLQALQIRERLGVRRGIARTLNNIGLVYHNLNDNEKALDYYHRSLKIKQELGDQFDIARTLGNIGYALFSLGRIDEAIEYQLRNRKLSEEIGYGAGVAYALNNLGSIYEHLGRNDEALAQYQGARQYYEESGDRNGIALALISEGSAQARLGKIEDAVASVSRAIAIAEEIQSHPRLRDAHQTLAGIFETRGDYQKALQHQRAYAAAADAILNEEKSKSITEMEIRYETEKKERRIELLTKDKAIQELRIQRQRFQNQAILGGLFLVMIITLLVFLRSREKQKANLLLSKKNRQIENSNSALASANQEIRESNEKLRAAYAEMKTLARIDPLTQIANRRSFLESATREAQAFSRHETPFVIALADVDHFKTINDTHGHDVGDFVLAELARFLRAHLRQEDLLGRWGGEEFIFLFTRVNQETGLRITEKLRAAIEAREFTYKDHSIPLRVTFGLREFDGGDLKDCIKQADNALYRGKEEGRNRVVEG